MTSRRAPWILLFVAIAGLAGFLATRGDEAPPGAAPSTGDGAAGPHVDARLFAKDGAAAASGGASDAPVRHAVRAAAASGAVLTTDGFSLTVVRGGEPVPGADVWSMTTGDHADLDWFVLAQEMGASVDDPEAVARRFGSHQQTDPDGRVTLAAATDRVVVFARHGDQTGSARFRLRHGAPVEEPVLELRRERSVRVSVVDPDDRPVPGVSVVCGPADDGGSPKRQLAATTDADGLAHLRHLHLEDRQSWVVEPEVAGASRDELRAPLPETTDGDVEIVIRVPPIGFVRSRVTRPDGRPWPVWGPAGVVPEEAPDSEGVRELLRRADEWSVPAVVGRRYRVSVRLGSASSELVVDGPRHQGDVVDVVFTLGEDSPVLTGRAVLPDGRPCPGAWAWVTVVMPDGHALSSMQQSVPLAADGSFAWALAPRYAGAVPERCRVVVRDGADRPRQAHPIPPSPLVAGEVPLGDVVMVEPPLLASGSVRIDGREVDYTPVLRLETEDLQADGSRRWRAYLPALQHSRAGRFGFFGDPPPGRMRITCTDPRLLPRDPLPCDLGARDLVLELSEGGDAEVVVRHASPMPSHALSAMLHAEPGASSDRGEPREAKVVPLNGDVVKLAWRSLRPGSYGLELFVHDLAEPVFVRSGLAVVAGTTSRWPEIELDDLVREVHLRAWRTDTAPAAPATGAWIAVIDAGSELRGPGAKMTDGTARLLAPVDRRLEVAVGLDGFETVRVPVSGGDMDVRLEPWTHAVELSLDAAVRDALPGVRWLVELSAEDGEPAAPVVASIAADPTKIRLPVPGRWRIALVVRALVGERHHRIESVTPATLLITSTAGDGVRLTVHDDALEAAARALR